MKQKYKHNNYPENIELKFALKYIYKNYHSTISLKLKGTTYH
jgi:hypothetical protein